MSWTANLQGAILGKIISKMEDEKRLVIFRMILATQ